MVYDIWHVWAKEMCRKYNHQERRIQAPWHCAQPPLHKSSREEYKQQCNRYDTLIGYKHTNHRDQEKHLEYMSRRTGVGSAEWKSFAANVPVAKKLICKGFERYSWQSFGPNVGYLDCSRALLCTDDSVLNEFLVSEWSRHEGQPACCAQVNASCALRRHNQSCLEIEVGLSCRKPSSTAG